MEFVSHRDWDWVARTIKRAEIDFGSLGSRWLTFNQLSYESCVAGIDRLGPGGHAAFRRASQIASTNAHWLPSFEPGAPDAAVGILKRFAKCALDHRYTPTLGLSGGLDSRLLLSILLAGTKCGFVTHTFGDPEDPEVRIAESIAKQLEIPHDILNDALPDVETCISAISEFVAQTFLIEPATSYLKLRYYTKLRRDGKLLIDGGFGEIGRRQYLNRVVRFGRSALRSRDASRLFDLMRVHRADIFSPDVTRSLQSGARRSLENTLEQMPAVEKIGIENFADLFAVRTRVPNYGAPEQSRIDAEVLNFMPLVQPSFLRAVFRVPVKVRSNAGLYYDAILRLSPPLALFPLVKAGLTYRFGVSSSLAWLITRMKTIVTKPYSDPNPHRLLVHLREHVTDVAHSKNVTSNPTYDSRAIIDAVTRYYNGDMRLRDTVDWWLTYELWQRSLSR